MCLKSGVDHSASVAHLADAFFGRAHAAGRDAGAAAELAGRLIVAVADVAEEASLAVAGRAEVSRAHRQGIQAVFS